MENFRLAISKLIIGAVLLATVVVCIGGIMYLWQHGTDRISYELFQGEPKASTTFLGIWSEAFSFSARGIIQLGLLLLVIGQSVRVLLTLCLFAKEKDYFFSIVSLVILVILIASLLGF